MNWTGGSLKRHARSHSNVDLKAQRTFFAEASRKPTIGIANTFRSGKPTLSSKLQHFGHLGYLTRPDQQKARDSHLQLQSRAKNDKSDVQDPRKMDSSVTSESQKTSHCGGSYMGSDQHDPRRRTQTAQRHHKATDIKQNTLFGRDPSRHIEEMKKMLLDQPDWLGLSAYRPAKIEFATTEDMARVGRHSRAIRVNERGAMSQVLGCGSHQNALRSITGKRKRSSDVVKHRASDVQECHSNIPTTLVPLQSQVNSDLARPPSRFGNRENLRPPGHFFKLSLILVDENRKSYKLAEGSAVGDDVDFLSLEEVRELGNFDIVREKYLSSKQQAAGRARDIQKAKDGTDPATSNAQIHHRPKNPSPDGNNTFARRDVSGTDHSTLDTRDEDGIRYAHASATITKSHECPATLPFPTLHRSMFAIRGCDLTDLELETQRAIRPSDSVGPNACYSCLATRLFRNSSWKCHRTEPTIMQSTDSNSGCRWQDEEKPSTSVRPLIEFRLDERFELKDKDTLDNSQHIFVGKSVNAEDYGRSLGLTSSPHFPQINGSPQITDAPYKKTRSSQRLGNTESHQTLKQSLQDNNSKKGLLYKSCRERPFTKAFVDFFSGDCPALVSTQSKPFMTTPPRGSVPAASPTRYKNGSRNSSSSTALEQGDVPIAIFSTPIKQPTQFGPPDDDDLRFCCTDADFV